MADYIAPYVEHSDEGEESKLITVSKFVVGDDPQELFGSPSYTLWCTDEDIVRTLGAYLANFRKASQQFEIDHPEIYEGYQAWDTVGNGWQKSFTPITIPTTPENFGVIHGDLHQGNMKIDSENDWAVSLLDFDNSQKSWYMVDLGTVAFLANQ